MYLHPLLASLEQPTAAANYGNLSDYIVMTVHSQFNEILSALNNQHLSKDSSEADMAWLPDCINTGMASTGLAHTYNSTLPRRMWSGHHRLDLCSFEISLKE